MTLQAQLALLAAGYVMGAISGIAAVFLGRALAPRTDRERALEDDAQMRELARRRVGTSDRRPLRGRPPIDDHGGTTTTKGSGDFLARGGSRWRGALICRECLWALDLRPADAADYQGTCERCYTTGPLYVATDPRALRPPWSGRGPSPLRSDKGG